MRYLKLFFILFSFISFANKNEITYLKYETLDKEARKNMDLFLLDTYLKFDNMKINFKTNYNLGKKKNIGEMFLNNFDENTDKKFKIGTKNNLVISKDNFKNVSYLYTLKSFQKDVNVLDLGVYFAYDLLKNKNINLNGINTGISFIANIPEYNIHLMSFNEYNYNFLKDKSYKANNLIGLIGVKYKQELAKLFY